MGDACSGGRFFQVQSAEVDMRQHPGGTDVLHFRTGEAGNREQPVPSGKLEETPPRREGDLGNGKSDTGAPQ